MQGFTMVRCIQGAKTLSLPMQMLGADLQAHKANNNHNPILKWCLTNTGVQTDRNGGTERKSKQTGTFFAKTSHYEAAFSTYSLFFRFFPFTNFTTLCII